MNAYFMIDSPVIFATHFQLSIKKTYKSQGVILCYALLKALAWEYHSSLQRRQKWNTSVNPFKIRIAILIKTENVSILKSPLSVIEKQYSIIREDEVRTT